MHRRWMAATLACVGWVAGFSAQAALPVPYGNLYPFTQVAVTDWNGTPAGANDWSCKPSAAHPYPVVLVTSTLLSQAVNWTSLSPYLRNRGYCVFAMDYGRDPYIPPGINGVGYLDESALEVRDFVERVRAVTGVSKVDIVGHSQGGIISRYYIQFLGGTDRVHTLVLLSSPNRLGGGAIGTVLNAVLTLLPSSVYEHAGEILPTPAVVQFSDPYFWQALNASNQGFSANVRYVQITSRADEFYFSGAYGDPGLPNVTTREIQSDCGIDFSTHFAIPYSRTAVALIGNALDPAHPVRPPCAFVPGFGLF